MSWHFSRALVEASSEAICSGGDVCVPSKSTPTPEAYYWPDKTTGHSRLSRYGMTSEPLTESRGAELLMWFLAGFPVRTSALPEPAKDSTESDPAYGQKWQESFAKYDPDSRSWRTHQHSLLGGLEPYSQTWPTWGSMRNGECWERPTQERPTDENESGFWPTLNCEGYRSDGELRMLSRMAADEREYLAMSDRATNSKRQRFWPATFTEGTAAAELVGRLNPDWCEWLMGWPIGWTALRPLETAKFREWQQQHGGRS